MRNFLFVIIACCLLAPSWAVASPQQQSLMTQFAPAECVVFSTWTGLPQGEAGSGNRTSEMMAEPAVKAFMDDMIQRLGLIPAAVSEDDETRKALAELGQKLMTACLQRSGCISIRSLDFDPSSGPRVSGGLALFMLGDQTAATNQIVLDWFRSRELTGESMKIHGMNFTNFKSDAGDLLIGSLGPMLMVATDKDEITRAVNCAKGKTENAPWLQKLQGNTKGLSHVSQLSYVNWKSIRRLIRKVNGAESEMAIQMMGLGDVESIELCSGLDDAGTSTRVLMRSTKIPSGVIKVFVESELDSDLLAEIPQDAMFAGAASIDPESAMQLVKASDLMLTGGMFAEGIREVNRELQIDIEQDLIANLGSTWSVYNGASDGVYSGLVMVGSCKDSTKLENALNRMISKTLIETASMTYSKPRFFKHSVGNGATVYSVQTNELPVRPSIAFTKNRIYISLFPQAIQAAFSKRGQSGSLYPADQLSKLRSSPIGTTQKLIAIAHVDEKRLMEMIYPWTQIASSMVSEFLGYGAPANLVRLLEDMELPPLRSIYPHLEASRMMVRLTDQGLEFESRQSWPAVDASLFGTAGLFAGTMGVNAVQTSAKTVSSQNNMRQIVLASLNYESVFQKFPSDMPRQGDSKLSWRVQILPFMEQNALYEKFRQDEPWDSPHNKQLLNQMPETFASPLNPAQSGMTTYRSFGGTRGIMNSQQRGKIGFGQIIDGSSNTLFVVDAPSEMSVPWTKPGSDIDPENFDFEKLMSGKELLAATCDGAAHVVPETIAKTQLQNYMMYNDGNVVEPLYEPRGNRRSRSRRQVDPMFILKNGKTELTLDNQLSEADKGMLRKQQELDRMKEIGLALHNHADAYRKFPAAYSVDGNGKPLLSWRVQVLPFLNQSPLYEQFKLDEPWDSPHNKQLIAKIPDCYKSSQSKAKPGFTNIMGNGGPSGVICKPTKQGRGSASSGIGFGQITDGTSNTLMLYTVDDAMAVEWTRPVESAPTPEVLDALVQSGFLTTLGDGSTRRVKPGIDKATLENLMQRNDGNVVEMPGDRRTGARRHLIERAMTEAEVEAYPLPEKPKEMAPVPDRDRN